MNRLLTLAVSFMISLTLYSHNFNLGKSDKAAILMVHFGTTFDDTRKLTIDALNEEVRSAFPDFAVYEAFTSRIVIKRLAARGVEKITPREALLRLAADGYTHVVVQSSNIIDGVEMSVLRREVEQMKPFFKEIRVGTPLLYSVDDCIAVADIMASRHADALRSSKVALVLVGHGTEGPATAIYSQIDYMLTSAGYPNAHVATVEGYPTYDTTLARLKSLKTREVTLVPFMFVVGDHARNDIDVEWRENLEKEGFKVSTVIEGLGSIQAIRAMFVERIKAALEGRHPDAVEQKSRAISNAGL